MKSYRQFLWGVLLLVPLLWWAWPSGQNASPGDTPSPAQNPKPVAAGATARTPDGPGPARTRSAQRQQPPSKPGKPAEAPEVGEVLANDAVSNVQAAARLHTIAMDRTRSTEERLEALQHGLNLDIATFAAFAGQPELPPELASHFLHEVINYNDSPATQLSTYMALMDHPDEEVSALAKEMLAFQVEDDLQEASREQLLQRGHQKIQTLTTGAGGN